MYVRETVVDPSPGGDTVKSAVLDLDTDLTNAFSHLNSYAADVQTLTNKTLTAPKINEDVALTATATELNVLDGVTASTAELNIMDGVTGTTGSGKMVLDTAPTVNNIKITGTASADVNTLDYYEEGTALLTLTGCTTSPTGTVSYTRIGNHVTLVFEDNIFGTSNTSAATLTGLPAQLRPSSSRWLPIVTIDNSTNKYARCYVQITTGTIVLFAGMNSESFVASGNKGVMTMTAAYTL